MGKCRWCVRLTTLPPSCAIVMISGNLNFLEPSGPLQACNGTALPLYYSTKRYTKSSKWQQSRPMSKFHISAILFTDCRTVNSVAAFRVNAITITPNLVKMSHTVHS